MPGWRGRAKPPPNYDGPLRRPGMRAEGPLAVPSNAEQEADMQCEELEKRMESMYLELTKDDPPSPLPGQTVDYPTPPSTPGSDGKNSGPVNGSAYAPIPVTADERPPHVPSALPQASSFLTSSAGLSSTGAGPSPSGTGVTTPSVTSTLNPFAQEFRPSFAAQVDTPTFPPDVPSSYTAPSSGKLYNCTSDDLALEAFNNTFQFLTTNPHQFDFVIDELRNSLEVYVNEESTLETITNCLMEWCINEPNFQYTGARLATYLNTNLQLDPNIIKIKFMSVFLTKCKQELLQAKHNAQTPSYHTRAIGYALFLGELYCTFRTETGSPMGVLRRGLLEILMLLFQIRTEATLIASGKILKMAGSLLGNRMYWTDKDKEEEITDLFKQMDDCLMDVATSKKAKEFLLSVIKLRESNWGQVDVGSPSPTTQMPPFPFPVSSQEPSTSWAQDDSLRPVTNPDQWDEFYTGEDDDAYEMTQYYSQTWSEGEVDDFDMEFKKFLMETGQLQ